jgi:hypothetical protein
MEDSETRIRARFINNWVDVGTAGLGGGRVHTFDPLSGLLSTRPEVSWRNADGT